MFMFITVQYIRPTVALKSLDTPTHSEVLVNFLHCKTTLKALNEITHLAHMQLYHKICKKTKN